MGVDVSTGFSGLLNLPVEVWHVLSKRLFFWHIMRLYACGSRRLIEIMTTQGGVTEAVMFFSGYDVTLGWVPQISEFSNLRTFVYDGSEVCSGVPFYPTQNELKMLSSKLRHFHMRSDAAEEAFLMDLISSDRNSPQSYRIGDILPISSVWPELEYFELIQYKGNEVADLEMGKEILISILQTLPASVISVTMRKNEALELEKVAALPKGLVSYQVTEDRNLNPNSFPLLPRQLQTYVSHSNLNISLASGIVDLDAWEGLPQQLTYLRVNLTQIPSEIISVLPPTLTYLNAGLFSNEACFIALNNRLRQLQALILPNRLGTTPGDWPPQSPISFYLSHIHRLSPVVSHTPSSFFTFHPPTGKWVPVYEPRFQTSLQ